METSEFLVHTRIDARSLEMWIEAGWLAPRRTDEAPDFSDVDLARALLILDLRQLGVNDEGIPVILDLVDQLHGLRRVLRHLLSAAQAQSAAGQDRGPDDDASVPGADRSEAQ